MRDSDSEHDWLNGRRGYDRGDEETGGGGGEEEEVTNQCIIMCVGCKSLSKWSRLTL